MKLKGHITKNRFDRLSELFEIFELLNDKDVTITIEKTRKDRSNQQNRYYRGIVCKILGGYLGYETEEMHEVFASMFLKDYKTVGETEYEYIRSTTTLSTVEMNDYIEECRRFASKEFGIVIEDPH
jgi:hypothetical protein